MGSPPTPTSVDSDEEPMDDAELLFRNKLKQLDITTANDGFEDLEQLIEDKTNENQELGRRLARQDTKFELLRSKLEHMDDDKSKLLRDLEKANEELMDTKQKYDNQNKESLSSVISDLFCTPHLYHMQFHFEIIFFNLLNN